MAGRLGLLGIFGGIAVLVLTNSSDSTRVNDLGAIAGVAMFVLGIVLWVVHASGFRSWKRNVLRSGLEGTAEVLEVYDTRTTVNQSAVFRLALLVTLPDREPYRAEANATVSRAQFGVLQPGAMLSVKVDPDRPDRVVIDRGREPEVEPTSAELPGLMVGGRAISESFTAADIVARGVAATGELGQIVPTGMTAGQVAPNLPPHEADDPLVTMSFTYPGPGDHILRTEAMVRVPDGKAALLVTGNQIPVRYLPDRPDVATIDWDRL